MTMVTMMTIGGEMMDDRSIIRDVNYEECDRILPIISNNDYENEWDSWSDSSDPTANATSADHEDAQALRTTNSMPVSGGETNRRIA